MSPPPATPHPVSRRGILLGSAGIGIAAIAAYSGSLDGPFLYDDIGSIPQNAAIRHLWPIWAPLMPPPGGYTVSGRPLVNLSLALNYAFGGLDVRGYHAVNLAIHLLAALVLFGIVRRTLDVAAVRGWNGLSSARSRDAAGGRFPHNSRNLWAAFAIALLWVLHPLQTESVTLVIQRAESLMGLFYLLTLYLFIRSVESERSTQVSETSALCFQILSIAACICAMATKEVAATAPILVLLYDRTFISGSFAGALRRRRGFYAGLASSWVLLAFLVLGAGGRGATAGFGAGVPWWAYALTQFRGVAHYLRLSIWPAPLVADYGRTLGGPPLGLAVDAAVVLGLLALTIKGVMSQLLNFDRESRSWDLTPFALFGFAGAWFFLILAPSSSVVPIVTEIIAEHRMYLPLAAVIAVVVVGGCAMAEGVGSPEVEKAGFFTSGGLTPWFLGFLCLGVAPVLGIATYRRNAVYQGNLPFWTDVVAKMPANAGAHNNLGNTYAEAGRLDEAMSEYGKALWLVPDYADAHADLANAFVKKGRYQEAIENYRAALRYRPDDSAVHYGLGLAFLRSGAPDPAIDEFARAVRLDPGNANAWSNLGELLAARARWSEAADAYAQATRLRPDSADARVNYGNVLEELGRFPDAVREYQAALALQPAAPDIHNNLGSLLAGSGRLAEARKEFEEALRLKPDYAEARDNLEHVLRLERSGSGQ